MKVRITTVDDDQGWLDSVGIDYKVNDIVEMTRAEFDKLNRYATNINNEVCGPAISVEDIEEEQGQRDEITKLMNQPKN